MPHSDVEEGEIVDSDDDRASPVRKEPVDKSSSDRESDRYEDRYRKISESSYDGLSGSEEYSDYEDGELNEDILLGAHSVSKKRPRASTKMPRAAEFRQEKRRRSYSRSPSPDDRRRNRGRRDRRRSNSERECRFFKRDGFCKDGDNCKFRHDEADEKRKPEPCKYYLSGGCWKGHDCPYLHGDFPCKYFHINRSCRKGMKCRFSHKKNLDPFLKKALDTYLQKEEEENRKKKPRSKRSPPLRMPMPPSPTDNKYEFPAPPEILQERISDLTNDEEGNTYRNGDRGRPPRGARQDFRAPRDEMYRPDHGYPEMEEQKTYPPRRKALLPAPPVPISPPSYDYESGPGAPPPNRWSEPPGPYMQQAPPPHMGHPPPHYMPHPDAQLVDADIYENRHNYPQAQPHMRQPAAIAYPQVDDWPNKLHDMPHMAPDVQNFEDAGARIDPRRQIDPRLAASEQMFAPHDPRRVNAEERMPIDPRMHHDPRLENPSEAKLVDPRLANNPRFATDRRAAGGDPRLVDPRLETGGDPRLVGAAPTVTLDKVLEALNQRLPNQQRQQQTQSEEKTHAEEASEVLESNAPEFNGSINRMLAWKLNKIATIETDYREIYEKIRYEKPREFFLQDPRLKLHVPPEICPLNKVNSPTDTFSDLDAVSEMIAQEVERKKLIGLSRSVRGMPV